MYLTEPDFLSVEEAFKRRVKYPVFIKYGDTIIGKKVDDEVFFNYPANESITLYIKDMLKVFKAKVIPDQYNPNRQAFLTITGQKVFFTQDFATYNGHIRYLMFPHLYTSDFKDLSVAYNILQILEGKRTVEEVNKIYEDVEEQYLK
ncbi:MAG: hypothetical protein JHC31_04690 [Sulfurihydrogenibium sp.]|jgi:hypothetical protein|nr:hypothetical protein [Sulfurihydrogenibium sp.]